MFPQQVTLSIILLSSLVYNATVAMESPISETMQFRTLGWSRTSSGTIYYTYPHPDNAKNNPYQGTPAAFETEFRQILSLNMHSHKTRGKSDSFLENYEAKQLKFLDQYKQVIIQQQKKF
jgi:hypothetical protein